MLYTLHPKLQVSIQTKNKRYQTYFKNEYSRIAGAKPDTSRTSINVHIVKQPPKQQDNDRVKTIRFKKLFTFTYVIRGLETDTVDIYFKDNPSGKLYAKNVTLFLQAQVLEPIVYYKLLERNILFMHAAAVSDGKHGYLLPAYGGTGKTTLTLGLMGEGMQVLGDDLLLVEPDTGIVHPYLRPLHIFTYNVKTLRGATLPMTVKAKVKTKDILRAILEKLTKQEFLIATRVHADTLYATFRAGKSVPFRKICFLKKTGEDEKIAITNKNIGELADKILESEDLNDSLYKHVLNPDEKEAVVKRELQVISNVLRKVPYIEFINTRLLDFKNLSDFKKKLTS